MIVADKFSIAPVATNPASSDGSPFYYLTSPTTIDGVMVPSGAYMKNAYIAALNANKIVAGNIMDEAAAGELTLNAARALAPKAEPGRAAPIAPGFKLPGTNATKPAFKAPAAPKTEA